MIIGLFTSCRGILSTTQKSTMQRTNQTEALFKNLKKQAKKGYMFGHQDATVYGVGWEGDDDRSDVKSVVGDYPAVLGFDIGHIELGNTHNLDSVSFEAMQKQIVNHYKRGGVITLSWHLDNPLTGGDSWDISNAQTVSSILSEGETARKFQLWLERAADFINSLQTEGEKVPVIFRPWHEHSGSWFWWGQNLCTVDEYKTLWRLTEKVFKEKGVNNVLLAYSPSGDAPNFMERYPGDDLIDLLGFDTYQSNDSNGTTIFIETFQNTLNFLKKYCRKHGKIYAITEAGYETIPNSQWWTEVLDKAIGKYKPTYVLIWRNAYNRENHFFAPYSGHISEENFKTFYNLKHTFFLNDLNSMYKSSK